jgi:hypothetical protein
MKRTLFRCAGILLMLLTLSDVMAQVPGYAKNGGGTSTNTIPWNTVGQKCQLLYAPSDFAPVPASGLITKIYFRNTIAGASASYDNLQIRFMQNNDIAFPATSYYTTGFTTVFSAVSHVITGNATAGGWFEVTLGSPYMYDNTKSLIVEIQYTNRTAISSGTTNISTITSVSTGRNTRCSGTDLAATTGTTNTTQNDFGIDLSTAACTSPPTPGTATTSMASVCSGSPATLGLTGSSVGIGLTYQWESASSSGGTYTPISGATSFSQVINPVSTLYYRCAITCSGSTDYSVPVMVAVDPALAAGTYTIDPLTPTGGANFHTFTEAIQAIRCGVAGPIIFDVPAGSVFTETVPLITRGGTSSSPIIFRKSGSGSNPVIIPNLGTGTRDFVIGIEGADYITFDGINVQDAPAATTNAERMEYGYAIFMRDAAKGSQHITIQNSTISLSNIYTGSIGIYSINQRADNTTAILPSDTNGSNSYIRILNDSILNSYRGISLNGANLEAGYDRNTEINGNYISGFGGAATATDGVYLIYQQNARILDNTITGGDNTSGSAIVSGIRSAAAVNANVEIAYNTVSVRTSTTTGAAYGIWNETGSTGVNNKVYIHHNTIRDFARNAATTGVSYMIYQNSSADSIVITHNNIYNDSTTGSGNLHAIYLLLGFKFNVSENHIYNLKRLSATSSNLMSGIYGTGSTNSTYRFYKNHIHGLSGSSAGTTSAICGIMMNVTGIFYIHGNNIHDISTNTSGVVYGINNIGSSVKSYIYNNFISDLRAPNSTLDDAIAGIRYQGGTFSGIYHNTIYLDAMSSSSGTFGSSGITANVNPLIDMRNNLIINNSIPGPTGGVVSAYRRSSQVNTSYSDSSDHNMLYVNTSAGRRQYLFFNGTDSSMSINNYKNLMDPRDRNSLTSPSVPPFLNITTAPYDLHIDPAIPAQIESNGIPVRDTGLTVMLDYDGDFRNTTTPDLGADEGNFTPADFSGPTIIYEFPNNTSSTANRTLVASITDNSGIDTNGLAKPVLYINRNHSGFVPVLPTISGDEYTFVIDYSLLGGIVPGDSVFYYIAAQDNNGNLSTSPSGGAGLTPPGSSAPPAPRSYTILQSLGGTYYVGTSPHTPPASYPTLTDAIADYNEKGMTGAVSFVLIDNLYNIASGETFPLIIQKNPEASAANTLTIRPEEGVDVEVGDVSTTAIIKLNGTAHVILDGKNSAGNNMTIVNQSTAATGTAVIWIANASILEGADSNQIRNCRISGQGPATTFTAIMMGNTTTISASAYATFANSHNLIDSNIIENAQNGILMLGASLTAPDQGNKISSNKIGVAGSTPSLDDKGIIAERQDNALFHNNEIQNIVSNNGEKYGMDLVNIRNSTISSNSVHDIDFTLASTLDVFGISLESASYNSEGSPSNNLVINNIIYNLKSSGNSASGSPNTIGLGANNGYGDKYYYNSVYMTNQVGTGAGHSAAFANGALTAANYCRNIDVRNNIFYMAGSSSAATAKLYAHYSRYTGTDIGTFNNNILRVALSGPGAGVLGFYNGADQNTLADWKTASGRDANSIDADPLFNDSSILFISPGSPAIGAGAPVAGIATDILGEPRSATTPTIGAYEQANDVMPPVFNVQHITSSSSITSRTLTGLVNITDASGINTTTYKPRVYYKKTTDDNAYTGNTSSDNGWKWTEALNTTSPFDFTLDYSILLGAGAASGDTIEYFFVAQDNSSGVNVGISEGAFNTKPDSVGLTATAFPVTGITRNYLILPSLAGGTYGVGASGSYPSLTAVAELLRTTVIAGNVIFELRADYDGETSETFPIVFNRFSGIDPSNTVTIRPEAGLSTSLRTAGDPGASANGLIVLDGVQNLFFDGRPDGVGDTSAILWTIRNKRVGATSSPTLAFLNDAAHNTFEYLNIQGSNSVATSGTILFSTTTGMTGNSSNTIRYNIIRERADTAGRPANAIFSQGTAGATNSGNTILGNRIINWTTSGILAPATGNGNNWHINNNHFYLTPGEIATTAQTAIRFIAASGPNEISENFIGGSEAGAAGTPWVNNGNIAWRGIVCASSITDSTRISNNTIQNVHLLGTGSGTFAGIELTGGLTSVQGNTIGHASQPNNILTSQLGTIIAIWINNTTNVTRIHDNLIANINSTGTTTAIGVNGIRASSLNTTAGVALEISNNHIHHLTANNPTTGTGTASLVGILCNNANTKQQVLNNLVHDMVNLNTTTATKVFGINVSNASSDGIINGNRIYNLNNTSTVATSNIAGIHLDLARSWTVTNNMITLGGNVHDTVLITGIFDKSANSTNRYYYNSVLIHGSTAGPGVVNTYGMLRNVATSILDVRNNIFFNKRNSAGIGFATGSVTSTGITTATFNHNLLVVKDTARISEFPSSVVHGVAAYNNLLFTPNGTYNTNWMEATANLSATDLFTDTATGDLSINTANPQSWYANGKGIALAGISGDYYTVSGTRSTTIISGTTDIGAVEFSTATVPPSALELQTPANGITSVYTFANRPVAAVQWGASGTVPSHLDVKFYSGEAAPAVLPGASHFNAYTAIVPSGGSGYSFDIGLLYDSAYLGSVSGAGNTRIAQHTTGWNYIASSAANTVSGMMSSGTSSTLVDFGNFTGTDAASNPLPVKLTAFNAKQLGKDVAVYWTTAAEINSDRFIVEASENGQSFREIGSATAAGNASSASHYKLVHNNARADMNNASTIYYRLVSLDKDGSSSISEVVAVQFGKEQSALEGTVAYPNPFSGDITISVAFDKAADLSVEIMDIRGSVIATSSEKLNSGLNKLTINNLDNFDRGIYFIRMSANGEHKVIKMIKQ